MNHLDLIAMTHPNSSTIIIFNYTSESIVANISTLHFCTIDDLIYVEPDILLSVDRISNEVK